MAAQRVQSRALRNAMIPLADAADRVGYSPEYLRTLMWRSDTPPPLFKFRGRWHTRIGEIDDWAAERDKAAAS